MARVANPRFFSLIHHTPLVILPKPKQKRQPLGLPLQILLTTNR
jgi:hypothetical protein